MFNEKNSLMKDKNFESQNSLVKTIKLELIPLKGSLHNILVDDIISAKNYKEKFNDFKKILNDLYIDFFDFSLGKGLYLSNLEKYKESFFLLNKNIENKKNLEYKKLHESNTDDLGKEIMSFLDNSVESFVNKYIDLNENKSLKKSIKENGVKILYKKEVLELLSIKFNDKKDLIEYFSSRFTGLSTLIDNKKNIFSLKLISGSILKRIINDNLDTFLNNIKKANEIIEKYSLELKEFGIDIGDYFLEIDNYNDYLTQNGINNYNQIINGVTLDGKKIRGLNELLEQFKNKTKDKTISKFKPMYKQLLSEVILEDVNSFSITSMKDMLDLIRNSSKNIFLDIEKYNEVIMLFLGDKNIFDIDKIYLSSYKLNNFSHKYMKDWSSFKNLINEYEKNNKIKKDDKIENLEFISLGKIKKIFDGVYENIGDISKIFKESYIKENIVFEGQDILTNLFNIIYQDYVNSYNCINNSFIELNSMYENIGNQEKNELNDDQLLIIKNYFDNLNIFRKNISIFITEKEGVLTDVVLKDSNLYDSLDAIYYLIKDNSLKIYNSFRNFVTKKKFASNSLELDFNYLNFLDGWDRDKTSEYGSILLKDKNGDILVGVLRDKNFVKNYDFSIKSNDNIYLLDYKQLGYKNVTRMLLPNLKDNNDKISKKIEVLKKEYGFNNEILSIYSKYYDLKYVKKLSSEEVSNLIGKKNINIYVNYLLNSLIQLYGNKKIYDFSSIIGKVYNNIGEFAEDIGGITYYHGWKDISRDYIFEGLDNGKIELFKLFNKDLKKKNKESKDDLFTMYFKEFFSENNFKNLNIKLSGGNKITYREKSDKKQEMNILKNGKKVISKKRFFEDKLFFHMTFVINRRVGKDTYINKFNSNVLKHIQSNIDKINILSMDRGEKNLLTICIQDINGKILETKNLNVINGVNYLNKLKNLEKLRDEAKVNFKEISKIIDLKEGYISGVVNIIVEHIIKYNAITFFEDLNKQFKDFRKSKIEASIYSEIEERLVKKLNYIVIKNSKEGELTHISRGLQLTPKIEKIDDIDKNNQLGTIFYVRAFNTSRTCPECGYQKNVKFTFSGKNEVLMNEIKNIKISFDKNKFYLSFEDGKSIFIKEGTIRYKYIKDKKINKEVLIFDELLELFNKYNINLKNDINKQIEEISNFNFFEKFAYLIKDTCDIRVTNKEKDIDVIDCPCCGFHSNKGIQGFNHDGDINGSYNIGRKGIILLNKIKSFTNDDIEKPKRLLIVSDKEWNKFLEKNN